MSSMKRDDFYQYLNHSLNNFLDYVKENYTYLVNTLIVYFVINIFLYFVVNCKKQFNLKGNFQNGKRVMFVISHPDDECMFFGPTIVKLVRHSGCNVFLLCLTNGNYYMAGDKRKDELWESCIILGIPSSNIILYKVTSLPDNPEIKWDEKIVANIVFNHVEQLKIDTVITFDKYGVSSHLNHISIYYALASMCAKDLIPKYCKVYCLDTVNICRKYSIIDVLFTVCFTSNWAISPLKEFLIVKKAMRAHKSQYVWFRKLYIHFAKYSFINTYTCLEKYDAEFDIQFRDM